MRILAVIAVLLCGAQPATRSKITRPRDPCDRPAVSDWDLYMLKQVNTARRKEGLGILRFDAKVDEVAAHRNSWMLRNIGRIESTNVPDSFSHYETLNAMSWSPFSRPAPCDGCVPTLRAGPVIPSTARNPAVRLYRLDGWPMALAVGDTNSVRIRVPHRQRDGPAGVPHATDP